MLKILTASAFSLAMLMAQAGGGCDEVKPSQSASGLEQTQVAVQRGSDGLTVEQRNVRDRLKMDNTPGSIKHLYVISSFSGQAIMYSTVKGKVTSSGKRLTPTTVLGSYSSDGTGYGGAASNVGRTSEVLQDDGTYGSSGEYLYWWDVQGRYHQIYNGGGTFIMLSDQPMPIKSVTINLEAQPN